VRQHRLDLHYNINLFQQAYSSELTNLLEFMLGRTRGFDQIGLSYISMPSTLRRRAINLCRTFTAKAME
jgi:hypothetical protein